MSGSLMSCVREHSPPLEMDLNASGPMSLPVQGHHDRAISGGGTPASGHSSVRSQIVSSTPLGGSSNNNNKNHKNASESFSAEDGGAGVAGTAGAVAEPKRRRFHPLRKLRGYLFRRRTITNVSQGEAGSGGATSATSGKSGDRGTSPHAASTSEKNLRSATLSSISSVVSASASSPSSPLSHQQLQDAYSSQSLPKSKSYSVAGHSHREALLAHAAATGAHSKHQQQQQQQQQRSGGEPIEMFTGTVTANAGTLASYHHSGMANTASAGSGTGTSSTAVNPTPRQNMGVAVLPSAMLGRNFFAERQKLRSVGDCSLDLDSSASSGNGSGGGVDGGGRGGNATAGGGGSSEMTDSQRSLSEGRLVDSDYSRDHLSQSHDSVFSESATASSLSNVLNAELADVLRKRRNRPDASDEDLGLPRSPATPQRRAEDGSGQHNHSGGSSSGSGHAAIKASTPLSGNGGNHSEVSTLSLLNADTDTDIAGGISMVSMEERLQHHATSTSMTTTTMTTKTRYSHSATISSLGNSSSTAQMSGESLRHSLSAESADEVDLFSSDWQRLSHSAAKHKMAIRPVKKKVPSRQHRRTLENSIPEANEYVLRAGPVGLFLDTVDDAKARTRSLPPGVNAKTVQQQQQAADEHDQKKKKKDDLNATATGRTGAIAAAAIVENKRSKAEQAANAGQSVTNTTSTSSLGSSSSSSSSRFGLRSLSAKATSMFESKETHSATVSAISTTTTTTSTVESTSSESTITAKTTKQKESVTSLGAATATVHQTSTGTTTTTAVETNESGFLRRLITRNSKRSAAKANAGHDDDPETQQSVPKKLQIASSAAAQATPNVVGLEEKRRGGEKTNRERPAVETKSGLSAMLNSFMHAEKTATTTSTTTTATTPSSQREREPSKPKSGPAARQRYLPQDIGTGNTLERKAAAPPPPLPSDGETSKVPSSTSMPAFSGLTSGTPSASIFVAAPALETFQSTSIIREITASQAASSTTTLKSDHHFEKKPKIVGLSAFQQKISRSSDSVGRQSMGSSKDSLLEATGEAVFLNFDETGAERQRKAVEKARSFRTYQEETRGESTLMATASIGGRNGGGNQPSLPDLSVSLRVPACFGNSFAYPNDLYSPPSPPEGRDGGDKSVSLGFEINDNNLVKPSSRAESASSLLHQHRHSGSSASGFAVTPSKHHSQSIIHTTTTTSGLAGNTAGSSRSIGASSAKSLLSPAPVVVPSLSPSTSCHKNISEIEQNIDLIVKSPFISVLRKTTATLGEEFSADASSGSSQTPSLTSSSAEPSPVRSAVQQSVRPTVLQLKERTTVNVSEPPPSPAVMTSTPSTVTLVPLSIDTERKILSPGPSTVTINGGTAMTSPTMSSPKAGGGLKTPTRRSSGGTPEAEPEQPTVPEFMKIQLNRVDPARLAKSNVVVLAKNVRGENSSATVSTPLSPHRATACVATMDRSSSSDDVSLRRFSNESVDINERDSPPLPLNGIERRSSGVFFEAVNKQARSASTSSLHAPKSPTKSTATSPTTPTKSVQVVTTSVAASPTEDGGESLVVLRPKTSESAIASATAVANGNKLSLQERKRLFLTDERSKTDRRIEEIRNERKKSINEEFYRKPYAGKSEEKTTTSSEVSNNGTTTTTITAITNTSEGPASPTKVEFAAPTVVMRKKSTTSTTTTNNSTVIASATTTMIAPTPATTTSSNNNNNTCSHKRDDSTPELMKVFARRSLKIREEDLNVLPDKVGGSGSPAANGNSYSSGSTSLKRFSHSPTSNGNGLISLSGLTANTTGSSGIKTQQSVGDSDKENQSASDEKLDKIEAAASEGNNVIGATNGKAVSGSNGSAGAANNRNSLADFRIGVSGLKAAANGLSLSNSHNNNNNNNSNNNSNNNVNPTSPNSLGKLGGLPPVKTASLRSNHIPSSHHTIAANNGNNNNNNNQQHLHHHHSMHVRSTTLERQTLATSKVSFDVPTTSASDDDGDVRLSRPIERSATVGEFKGIHQRRAEWEQRAKEALK